MVVARPHGEGRRSAAASFFLSHFSDAHTGEGETSLTLSLVAKSAKQRGPDGWENWRALDRGLPSSGRGFEISLYSDSRFVDEVLDGMGPYKVLNTVPGGFEVAPGRLELTLVLRVEIHDSYERAYEPASWNKVQLGAYHGGSLGDEFAALIALALGVRLRSGGITRSFGWLSDDPKGKPGEFEHYRPPIVPPPRGQRSMLPQIAQNPANLSGLAAALATYPEA